MGNINNLPAETLQNIKIGFIFFIWAWAFISGILPAKIKACKDSQKFLSLASAFSGGVFLSMALIHILPEASSEYTELKCYDGEEVCKENPQLCLTNLVECTAFPLPYLLVFCGYTLILIIDKVMFDSHALLEGGEGHGHGHGHGHGQEESTDNIDDHQINKT